MELRHLLIIIGLVWVLLTLLTNPVTALWATLSIGMLVWLSRRPQSAATTGPA